MLLFFILFLVLANLILTALRVRFFEPARLFVLPWMISAAVLAIGLVDYDKVFSPVTFTSITTGIIAFLFGALGFREMDRLHTKSQRSQAQRPSLLQLSPGIDLLLRLGLLAYVFLITLTMLSFLRTGGFAQLGLADLRALHWAASAPGVKTVEDSFRTVVRVSAIFYAVALPTTRALGGRRWWWSLMAWSALLGETVLIAGRFLPVFVLSATIVGYVSVIAIESGRVPTIGIVWKRWSLPAKGFTVAFLGALIYFIFAIFPVLRNPALVANVDVALQWAHGARLSQRTRDWTRSTGFSSLPIVAYGFSYVSEPIVAYTFIVDNSDIESWYYLGQYNVPTISKAASLLSGTKSKWQRIRDRIARVNGARRYNYNPWSTGIRDLVIDFGFAGASVALFLFGILSQGLFTDARRRPTVEKIVLASIVTTSAGVFAFFSPFVVGPVLNTIYLCLALMTLRHIQLVPPRGHNA